MLKFIAKCKLTHCSNDKLDFGKFKLDFLCDSMIKLINNCFLSGNFPECEKEGIISPLIKNFDLNPENLDAYRPVTELPVIPKLAEIAMHDRLTTHLDSREILPELQSALRPNHSTETALVKVHSDIINSLDNGKTVCMIFLDLSSAFDTVDHEILINELQSIGIEGTALKLFKSYLENRTVRVSANGALSDPLPLKFGIPQGSVLAPTLFSIYTRTLSYLLKSLGVSFHIYADDTQIYFECNPSDIDSIKAEIKLIF